MDLKKFDIFNFNKPGPGVPEDEPELPKWRLFFRQFFSKIIQILGLNFLYVLFSIPSLIVAYFSSYWILGYSFDKFFNLKIETDFVAMITPRVILGLMLVMIPAVAFGPIHAGFTYVLRNFSRQRHAYVWWDFKDHALANFKQGMIVTLINFVIIFILGLAINSYAQFAPAFTGIISYGAIGFVSLALVIFLGMNMYIYPLMISYDMKIRELYKVAYSFAFLRLLPNILIILGIAIVLTLAFGFIPIVGVILTAVILPGAILYAVNFFVDPIIKKFEEEQDEFEAEGDSDIIE